MTIFDEFELLGLDVFPISPFHSSIGKALFPMEKVKKAMK